jgi:hypothetical protein
MNFRPFATTLLLASLFSTTAHSQQATQKPPAAPGVSKAPKMVHIVGHEPKEENVYSYRGKFYLIGWSELESNPNKRIASYKVLANKEEAEAESKDKGFNRQPGIKTIPLGSVIGLLIDNYGKPQNNDPAAPGR